LTDARIAPLARDHQLDADDADLSTPGAAVRTVRITAREDLEIARQAHAVPGSRDAGDPRG
jgi:hypothetical protein